MHNFATIIYLCALLAYAPFAKGVSSKPVLIWSDEFDGDSIDTTKWNVGDNYYHCCNNELQIYVKDEVIVKGGYLILRSSQRSYDKYNYTSGWVDTSGKFSTLYGRVEVRAKLPSGKGLWPAHWMLPENGPCWPVAGEIDIMEYLGVDPQAPLQPVHGTLHWSKNKTCNWDLNASQIFPAKTAKPIDFVNEFHVFAVEWRKTNVKFFVDDQLYHTVPQWLFTPSMPFYVILNTAVGGDWGGNPDAKTVFPQYHYIDFVRVYKL